MTKEGDMVVVIFVKDEVNRSKQLRAVETQRGVDIGGKTMFWGLLPDNDDFFPCQWQC